jgi:hypothetical protein
MILADDLNASLDPYGRRAPQAFWNDLYETIEDSKPLRGVPINELNADEIDTLVCRIAVTCERLREDHGRSSVSTPIMFERDRSAAQQGATSGA